MDAQTFEAKRSLKEKIIASCDQEDDDDNVEEEDVCLVHGGGGGGGEKKKGFILGGGEYGKRGTTSEGGGASPPSCQVEKCGTDLSDAKRYHRRHKVCEVHAKAPAVVVAGLRQRFCQQCSRFHELTEFDETKRSCRRRLAGHNERRRKSSTADSNGDGSGRKSVVIAGIPMKESQFRQAGERESSRFQVTLPGNLTCNRSQF